MSSFIFTRFLILRRISLARFLKLFGKNSNNSDTLSDQSSAASAAAAASDGLVATLADGTGDSEDSVDANGSFAGARGVINVGRPLFVADCDGSTMLVGLCSAGVNRNFNILLRSLATVPTQSESV
ncbi:hypothetical protein, partial [Neptuniibacter sp.]|uniref:hypothetical protein n=1 Tax=Neptuniibacter sp. TaxID=1962643 RepID=UPI00261FF582